MDRRSFLRFLGAGAAAAVTPTKTYAFFGGILRPRPIVRQYSFAAGEISPCIYDKVDVEIVIKNLERMYGIIKGHGLIT